MISIFILSLESSFYSSTKCNQHVSTICSATASLSLLLFLRWYMCFSNLHIFLVNLPVCQIYNLLHEHGILYCFCSWSGKVGRSKCCSYSGYRIFVKRSQYILVYRVYKLLPDISPFPLLGAILMVYSTFCWYVISFESGLEMMMSSSSKHGAMVHFQSLMCWQYLVSGPVDDDIQHSNSRVSVSRLSINNVSFNQNLLPL